jgi:DNA helicase HerA-like ATPase
VAEGLVLGFKEGEDRSMLVIGAPGTGKSLFMDYVLENVGGDVNVVVLDPTGEHAARLAPPPPQEGGYRVLVAGKDYMLNPVSLPNAYDVLYYAVSELWREGLRAFPAEILSQSLERARTLVDVVRNVEATMKSSAREDVINSCAALLRRLRPLIHPALLGESGLPEGRVVIDLSAIEGDSARRAFVLTFLYSVYFAARRGEWSGIIVIDEADRYAGEAADWVADELRKYGVSIWAVGHSVERVPGRLRDARYTFIFATKDPENLTYAREVFPREVVEKLPYLSFGQAAFQERGRQPMIVSVHLSRGGFYARRAGAGLREIALKYGLSEYTLSVEFAKNQDVRDIILRATSGAASPEDYRKLREKGLDPVKDAKLIYALGELYSSQGGSRGGA